jgi:hypothetical protein
MVIKSGGLKNVDNYSYSYVNRNDLNIISYKKYFAFMYLTVFPTTQKAIRLKSRELYKNVRAKRNFLVDLLVNQK